MQTTRRLARLLATVMLGGLTCAGLALADDTQPLAPQPSEPDPAAAQGRTHEPEIAPVPVTAGVRNEPARTTVDKPLVDTYLRTWPERNAVAARTTIAHYGLPNEATPTLLIWHESAPWKRTVVYREGVKHDFPRPHMDVIEQVTELRVPLGKLDAILAFDGSLIVQRTEGTIASRCESEAMNFVAINLAYDISRGKLTSAQARAKLARAILDVAKGEPPAFAQGLLIEALPEGETTADPDKSVMKPDKPTTPQTPSPSPRPGRNGPNPGATAPAEGPGASAEPPKMRPAHLR